MPLCRKLSFVLILFVAVLGLAALPIPPAFTASGNPTLYKDLHQKALNNLTKLESSQRKAYKSLLQNQDDVLMAYLLAYESDGTLAQASPADVFSNYRQIRFLLETRGTTLDPEFFLSYVADQTVSDERLEAYRAALLDDGLREIMDQAENELELYRAVSQWCVARLKFQPTSGRDQSPLDITQKSVLGRCEEMQILFVAAARTVGLPARAASTPWWPHMDNNHAWAEVWLDGAWHYTGDMDAAYYADQTWFSGLIDKTVLILADGTLPSASDEVLVRGKYDCVINSVRNYAKEHTRALTLKTVDAEGNALPKTSLGIMVYNWNSLRPLVYVESDSTGAFTLSVGRGAFYVLAYKDGKQALQLISSGAEKDLQFALVLKDQPLADQDAMLAYPANPFEWKQAPQSWNDGVARAREQWDARESEFSEHFAAYPDSLTGAFAAACRGNYPEFVIFYDRLRPLDGEFLAYALSEDPQYIDPKFLWQASAEQLEALYWQFETREHGFSYEDLASVIAPTVFYEELSRPFPVAKKYWSAYPKSFYNKGETRLEKLNRAMTWLKKNYEIDAKRALEGLLPLDIAIRHKQLTSYQYRILAVAVARANGVPAEFSRQPDLIYVQYDNGRWGYYDLKKCAPEADVEDTRAFSGLRVLVSDENGVPLPGISKNLLLCRYQDGSFYWLDQNFSDSGIGASSISVPKGEYYLNFGYRVSDSQTAFQLKRLDLTKQDSLEVRLTAREYPRNWEPAAAELLSILADVDTAGFDAVVIGHGLQENSVRLTQKLEGQGVRYLLVDFETPRMESPSPIHRFSPVWSKMAQQDQRNRQRTITLYRRNGVWQSYEGLWDRLPR